MNLTQNQILQIKLGKVYYKPRMKIAKSIQIHRDKTGFYNPDQIEETKVILKSIQNYQKNEIKIMKSKSLHQSRQIQESLNSSGKSMLQNTNSDKSHSGMTTTQAADTTQPITEQQNANQDIEVTQSDEENFNSIVQGYTILISNKGIFHKLANIHKNDAEKKMFEYTDITIRKRRQNNFVNLQGNYKYIVIGQSKPGKKHNSYNQKYNQEKAPPQQLVPDLSVSQL